MRKKKSLNDYLSLPYTIEFRHEQSDGNGTAAWFARVVELPGCITEGDTLEEAARMIQDAMASWIEVALEDGRPIPEPKHAEDYSGKFVVRLPKSLHRDVVHAARRDGASLNQWISVALSRAVSMTETKVQPGANKMRQGEDDRPSGRGGWRMKKRPI